MKSLRALTLMLVFAAPALAQAGTPAAPAGKGSATTPQAAKKKEPSPRERLGLDLLDAAVASSRKMDGVSQGQSLWQAARIVLPQEGGRDRAIELLESGFYLALGERDRGGSRLQNVRTDVESRLLRSLIPLDVAKAEELLPRAEEEARRPVQSELVRYYVQRGKDAHALELLRQGAAEQEMSYNDAILLMERMKSGDESLRRDVFVEALASFSAHDHKQSLLPNTDDFTAMILHFHQQLPPELVRQAIEEVLSQAKKADAEMASSGNHLRARMTNTRDEASWTSFYDYQLFALLDALRQADPVAAAARIKESPAARALLEQFEHGITDLAPSLAGIRGNHSLSMDVSIGDAPPTEHAVDPDRLLMMRVHSEMNEHGEDALAKAAQLKRAENRARSYADIGEANWKKHPATAREALRKALEEAAQCDAKSAGEVYTDVAASYAHMKDDEAALKTLEKASAVVTKLYEKDTSASTPNLAPTIFWPSSVQWVRLVRVAARVSEMKAVELLRGAPTEEMGGMGQMVVAAQLLNVEYRASSTIEIRPGSGWTSGGEEDRDNDQARQSSGHWSETEQH